MSSTQSKESKTTSIKQEPQDDLKKILTYQSKYFAKYDEIASLTSCLLGGLSYRRMDTESSRDSDRNKTSPEKRLKPLIEFRYREGDYEKRQKIREHFYKGKSVQVRAFKREEHIEHGNSLFDVRCTLGKIQTQFYVHSIGRDKITLKYFGKQEQPLGKTPKDFNYSISYLPMNRLESVATFLDNLEERLRLPEMKPNVPGEKVLTRIYGIHSWTNETLLKFMRCRKRKHDGTTAAVVKIEAKDDGSVPNSYFSLTVECQEILLRLLEYLKSGSRFELVNGPPDTKTDMMLELALRHSISIGVRILISCQFEIPSLILKIFEARKQRKFKVKMFYYAIEQFENEWWLSATWYTITEEKNTPDVTRRRYRHSTMTEEEQKKIRTMIRSADIVFANPIDLNYKCPIVEKFCGERLQLVAFDLTILFKAHQVLDGVAMIPLSMSPRSILFANSISYPLPKIRHPENKYHEFEGKWQSAVVHILASFYSSKRKTEMLDTPNEALRSTLKIHTIDFNYLSRNGMLSTDCMDRIVKAGYAANVLKSSAPKESHSGDSIKEETKHECDSDRRSRHEDRKYDERKRSDDKDRNRSDPKDRRRPDDTDRRRLDDTRSKSKSSETAEDHSKSNKTDENVTKNDKNPEGSESLKSDEKPAEKYRGKSSGAWGAVAPISVPVTNDGDPEKDEGADGGLKRRREMYERRNIGRNSDDRQ